MSADTPGPRICLICYMLRFHIAPGYNNQSKTRALCPECKTTQTLVRRMPK